MEFNHEFLEIADIVPAFVPIDMEAGANNGQWINMRYIAGRLVCVLFKAAGTASDDPVFTLKQALTSSGGTPKALNFTRIRTKIGAIASTPLWTIVTQAAAGTYTPTSAASQALIAVEVGEHMLDINNGYSYVQMSIPDTGSAGAQLGCGFYIAYGLKFAQNNTTSVLSLLA